MTKLRNFIRLIMISVKHIVLTRLYNMDIAKSARISFGAKLDKTNPSGIHIGDETYITSGAIVFTHDFARGLHADTYIGKRCFIGANAIVMCGTIIGDNVIIGSGSVVTKNIPSNCIAVGNPARVIKENIHTKKYGQLDCT